MNPIEPAERSTLIVATTIHNLPSEELVRPEMHETVALYSPLLFGALHEQSAVKQIEGSQFKDGDLISQKSTKVSVQ